MSRETISNVALADGTNCKYLDLSVRMKAVEGDTDRGGGLTWRAEDMINYYSGGFDLSRREQDRPVVEVGRPVVFR
ncbi:MAG: hypothetical protein ACLQIB_14630 [Isosphaeraceae bacterium]